MERQYKGTRRIAFVHQQLLRAEAEEDFEVTRELLHEAMGYERTRKLAEKLKLALPKANPLRDPRWWWTARTVLDPVRTPSKRFMRWVNAAIRGQLAMKKPRDKRWRFNVPFPSYANSDGPRRGNNKFYGFAKFPPSRALRAWYGFR